MAGIGMGMGIGFGGRLRPPTPPLPETIIRRFQERQGSTLIDSIANRDATVLTPVSSFNGVDGIVSIPQFDFSIGKYVEFYSENNNSSTGHILGNRVDTGRFNGVRFSGGDLTIMINGVVSSLPNVLNIGESALIKVVRNSIDEFEVFKNNVSLGIINNNSYISSFNLGYIGGRHDELYYNGWLHSINLNNELHIPLPHTGYGIDQNGNGVQLTVSGGVTEDYDENGSTHYFDYGATLKDGVYVPNNLNGGSIVEGGIYISPTSFINATPFMVRLFTAVDTDPEYAFFDKSNTLIWKQSVRDSVYYDVADTGLWHSSELTQQFIYDNIQDAEKYKWWIRLISNQYKDLFLYATALTGDNICRAKKYVRVGETITDLTGMESDILCNNDILKE